MLYIYAHMGQVNIRVPDDKVEGLRARLKATAEALGTSQGDVLERGIARLSDREGAAPSDLSQKIYERTGRIENMVEELLGNGVSVGDDLASHADSTTTNEYLDPASIPGVQVGPKSKCDHCGLMRAPRRMPLCTICANAGHSGDPRNCGECTAGVGV